MLKACPTGERTMRRTALVLVIMLGIGLSFATTGEKDKLVPFTITFHGQSFYVLKTTKGKVIAFDPHFIEVYQIERDPWKADIICVSHNHNDHNRVQVFENHKKAKILTGLKGPSL